MNTAWSASYALWSPLHRFLRRLLPAGKAAPVAGLRPALACARPTATLLRNNHAAPRPLRVVRVMEAGQPRSQVGRMVISGRMADVCAELDRLAAIEGARL